MASDRETGGGSGAPGSGGPSGRSGIFGQKETFRGSGTTNEDGVSGEKMAFGVERVSGDGGSASMARGAALLGGAALLSKLIGTLQKIPLQNLAGDQVFGLYSAVYALAVMWMTLAAAGVPVAVSVLVAERTAVGDELGARRVLRWSAGLLSVTGLIAFALLQWGANLFAEWMGAPEAADAIRTSSIALLFAPLTAALRGYSQGRMDMLRPAVSQLVEQSARVAFMLVMLFWALDGSWSAGATAAAVHGGLAAGAAAGLIALLRLGRGGRTAARGAIGGAAGWDVERPAGERLDGGEALAGEEAGAAISQRAGEFAGDKVDHAQALGAMPKLEAAALPPPRLALLRRIAAVALPVAAASVVAPLFGLIDAFTVPRLLQSAGDTAAAALAVFGEYNRGIALLQLIVMAAGGAAAAIVPALTAARTRGDTAGQREQAASAMQLAWLFGAAAAVGLALLAEPVNVALFADGSGTFAMTLLAFAALGGTLQAVSAALLQGLGDLRSPALNLAAAVLLKAALNAALAPAFGIAGAAISALAAYAAAAALNARALRRRLAQQQPPLRAGPATAASARPATAASARATSASAPAAKRAPTGTAAWRTALALAAMAAAVALLRLSLSALTSGLPARAAALITALPSIAAGALVYAAALVALGTIGPRQWRALPGFSAGSAADRLLSRLQPRAARQSDSPCSISGDPFLASAARSSSCVDGPDCASRAGAAEAAASSANQSTPEG